MKLLKANLLFFFFLVFSQPGVGQDYRQKDIKDYVWDLSPIFPSDDAWATELSSVREKIKSIGGLKGTMGRSSKSLLKGMDEIYDLRARAAKMSIYGSLRSDVDTEDESAQAMSEVASALELEVESAISFLSNEITSIGLPTITAWMRNEPGLQRHKRRINRIFFESPHVSSPERQAVIESMQGWPNVSGDGIFAFYESDLKWPTYKNESGADVTVSYFDYGNSRRSTSAKVRVEIPKAFLGFLGSYEILLGYLYSRRIDADLVIARHRKFNDGINCMWNLRDGVPEDAYKTMIKVARDNKPLLKRYADVLTRVLQMEKIGYQDFYSAPKSYTKTLTIAESWDIVFKALAPLGKEYVDISKIEISKPTTHLIPSPKKRGFYANQAPIAGIPSYTMLTFTGTYGNLRSLSGIATSKVRASTIPKGNWPDTRDDPPIFGNAMLYTSEMLLDDYLISHAASKDERIFHLHNALYRLWVHCFREVINTELDAAVQQMIIESKPPSGRKISETYISLLRSYYGPIEVSDDFAREWMVNTVQFNSYENQLWPAAMAAGSLVHDKIVSGNPDGKKAMLGLMERGEIDLSYQALKTIGVDMLHASTYQGMYDRMEKLIALLEKELGK